jgi:sodium transport system ATP-binding protein
VGIVEPVEVEGLSRKFGDRYAVKELSFTVRPGEVFGLLGPNGAGKTTAIRMLSTVITPHAGTARVNGFDIREQGEQVRASLGVLTTFIGLYERFTARENIEYFARLYEMQEEDIRGRVDYLLDLLDARSFEDQRVVGFSTGMRQKVAIARSVVHDPPVIIFDEPTLGLDVLASRTVRQFIRDAKSRGRTIILSTHDMLMAQKMCDRVAVIHDGELVALASPDEILEHTGAPEMETAFIRLVAPEGGDDL